MKRTLEMMADTLTSTFGPLWASVEAWGVNPLFWVLLVILGVGLPFVVSITRAERRKAGLPKLLISLGNIKPSGGTQTSHEIFDLAMTVSNLSPYPVQILELALKTEEMPVPVTSEVARLLAPNASVRIEESLTGLRGEAGKLNLYLYAPATQQAYFRLQATFAWEPWNARHKVSPLEQTLLPAKGLASVTLDRVREREWREQEETQRVRQVQTDLDYHPKTEKRERFEFPEEF